MSGEAAKPAEATEAEAAAAKDAADAHHDGAVALRNALKLGLSLIGTWTVALVVRFQLPRYLGPGGFGQYSFASGIAETVFVFLGLGVDTYIQREISVRPKHASDFFLGTMVARALMSVPLLVGMYAFLVATHKPSHVQLAAVLFGVTQMFVTANQTFSAMIQASTKVGGLAVWNVASKVLWGGGTIAAVWLGAPFVVLVLPMLASEAMKATFLYRAARNAVDLDLRLDAKVTKKVLAESFPFFIAALAVSLSQRLDVTMLEYLSTNEEVGWFASAQNIAGLAMLLSPLVSWVLMPMMTRAKARSDEEFFGILRRAIEGIVVLAVPVTLMLALGADVWIGIVFFKKPEFAPAAVSLAWIAPTFVFTYGAVLLWLALMILGRSWTITLVSIGGLIALPVLILVVVPLTRGMGPGGAGLGTALALSIREAGLVATFALFLGKRAFDLRSLGSIAKSAIVCAVVAGIHVLLVRLGSLRLVVDSLAYVLLAFTFRIVTIQDVKNFVGLLKARKRGAA